VNNVNLGKSNEMMEKLYQFKRTAIHNLCITSSLASPEDDIKEGLIICKELMELADIMPYERLIVTKIGGNNWKNRIYTFAIPGEKYSIEARGSLAHLLRVGDFACIISEVSIQNHQYQLLCANNFPYPAIDIRFFPEIGHLNNNISEAKITLEFSDIKKQVKAIDPKLLETKKILPRVMLSNLVTGLRVAEIERHCIEMDAELPVDIMLKAGLMRNQMIFVYNTSRGGISAESYVVPNTRNNNVAMSGALSNFADLGDIVSEAAFVITNEIKLPIIYNIKTGNAKTYLENQNKARCKSISIQ